MDSEELSKMINPREPEADEEVRQRAMRLHNPAARLAVWLNKDLKPPRRIEYFRVHQLNDLYLAGDIAALSVEAMTTYNALEGLIAVEMRDDLERREKEGEKYERPWWA